MNNKKFHEEANKIIKAFSALPPSLIKRRARLFNLKRIKYPYTVVFLSKTLCLKENGFKVGEPSSIPSKYLAPTLAFYDNEGLEWHLQPRVKRHKSKIACEILKEKCPSWEDAEPRNCGWLNNKPVVIDW